MKILWIGFVWPEPQSSAAGMRTQQLLAAARSAGHEVRFASPCQRNGHFDRLESEGFAPFCVRPNDDSLNQPLLEFNPEIVVFDRFMIEEQFSWKVKSLCPESLRILDTCDLHSLRRTRQRKVEAGEDPDSLSAEDLSSDDALREVAAIYRSDLSLIVSDFELALLIRHYQVPSYLLTLSRFFYPPPEAGAPFEDRSNFVTIGNFQHAPNADSYRLLAKSLWPRIRERFVAQGTPAPELHIYGAYPSAEFQNLDNPARGVRLKGWTESAKDTLGRYRVNLAPLRFGAGLKGKITDAWSVGTPSVTTAVGAEGLHTGFPFGGKVEPVGESFAAAAFELYTDRPAWESARNRGMEILNTLFSEEKNSAEFKALLAEAGQGLAERRARNFTGAMLWHHLNRSTEYMSRWIELKNALPSQRRSVAY